MFRQNKYIEANYNASRHNDRFLLDCSSMVMDEDLRFQIEKIPPGVGFLDAIKFKNLLTSSINGHIVKVFNLKNYLVYLYTNNVNSGKVMLLEKIHFLKTIISENILSELWVVKDFNYTCVGIFNSVPIFLKSFQSIFEINEHMQMMIEHMNQYTEVSNIRFFCCSSDGFYKHKLNIFEYSEQFMTDVMCGYTSINEYCKDMRKEKEVKYKKNVFFSGLSSGLLLLAGACYVVGGILKESTNKEMNKINMLSNKSKFPSKIHYELIKQIEAS